MHVENISRTSHYFLLSVLIISKTLRERLQNFKKLPIILKNVAQFLRIFFQEYLVLYQLHFVTLSVGLYSDFLPTAYAGHDLQGPLPLEQLELTAGRAGQIELIKQCFCSENVFFSN